MRRHFAFACVDIVIIRGNQVMLARRNETPYRGFWHLPGGIIHKGETIAEKIQEVARREIGTELVVMKPLGTYENIFRSRHDISCAFVARLKDETNSGFLHQVKFFSSIPEKTIPYHKEIINDAYAGSKTSQKRWAYDISTSKKR